MAKRKYEYLPPKMIFIHGLIWGVIMFLMTSLLFPYLGFTEKVTGSWWQDLLIWIPGGLLYGLFYRWYHNKYLVKGNNK